ncbi:MAG: hypothetical protein WCR71_02315 [Bacteroidales bacterium]
MRNRNRYSHIKSMSQLQSERARLDSDIEIKRALFSIQHSRFKESIKIGNLISSFIASVSIIIPLIIKTAKTFKDLYNFILAQFKSEKQEEFNSENNNNSHLKN